MSKMKKMALTAMIAAITTVTSNLFFIPVGFTRIFPMQHFANVITAVLLGPAYAVAQAIIVSTIRNISGTGSIFAYPGSIIGAFLAGWLFMKTRKMEMAFVGEVVGTGIIGAMACYPIATLFLGQEAALFGFIPAFFVSSCAGAILGFLLLKVLMKNSSIGGIIYENSTYNRRI
ncbi:energy coupling factor transporter S component ThiW [Lederbergia graminis]|uniref:Energy coupling factor transporter S component ThiW n=1 Tax=Lederbergia graminis TaxID=735518 RepID=A0ABW0LFP5_9BACI|nr:energy coupling factor transporter S component ThiW [Paenibacillus bovis]